MDGRQRYHDIQPQNHRASPAHSPRPQPTESPQHNNHYQQPQYHQPEPQMMQPEHHGYYQEPKSSVLQKSLVVALVLLLIGGAGAGVYYWQQKRMDDLQARQAVLTGQTTGETQQSASSTTGVNDDTNTANAPELVANGQASLGELNGEVVVQSYYLPGSQKMELTLEYGINANKLDQQTDTIVIQPKADNATLQYNVHTWTLKASDLKPGKGYFYRTIAVVNGQTYDSGLSVFVTAK